MASQSWLTTDIAGVLRRATPAMGDERGSFSELWRASTTGDLVASTFVQANLSRSRAGVLRGMHFHRHQVDLWIMLEGRAIAATTDLRGVVGDLENVTSQAIELAAGDTLLIPPLVAHGFWAVDDMALLYLVSNEYDGSDEYGFAWNDPAAAVPWPPGKPILSTRDRNNPKISDVAASLRQQSSVT